MAQAAALIIVTVAAAGSLALAAQNQKSAPVTASTPHLSLRATLSESEAAPGTRISIAFNVTPKPRMHVYAPGGKYRAVGVTFEPRALIKVHDAEYSKAETYFFEPLNEHALVYSEPFQLALDVTLGETVEQLAQIRGRSRLTLKGTFEYQACDERICYLPASVPLEWTIKIKR